MREEQLKLLVCEALPTIRDRIVNAATNAGFKAISGNVPAHILLSEIEVEEIFDGHVSDVVVIRLKNIWNRPWSGNGSTYNAPERELIPLFEELATKLRIEKQEIYIALIVEDKNIKITDILKVDCLIPFNDIMENPIKFKDTLRNIKRIATDFRLRSTEKGSEVGRIISRRIGEGNIPIKRRPPALRPAFAR